MSFNINKHGVGQVNYVTDHEGKTRYRQDKLLFMVGEVIQLIECVYDPDHILYQHRMPISKEEYQNYQRSKTGIPIERQGPNVMCSCGVEGVLILDPKAPAEWQNKILCKSVAQFGIHQTSFKIVNNKATLPKHIEQDKIMTDNDMKKLFGDEK